jgi:NADP-dependent 3-hydroxy acid dehydrogenase YdfG
VRLIAYEVTRGGDIDAAVAEATREGRDVDIVVANAGFGAAGALQKLTPEDYRRGLETNAFGVLRTVYATLADVVVRSFSTAYM